MQSGLHIGGTNRISEVFQMSVPIVFREKENEIKHFGKTTYLTEICTFL